MSEETKSPTPPPTGQPKPAAGEPIPGTIQSTPAQKPEAAAPSKAAGPAPLPWDSPMVAKLKAHYGSGIRETNTYLGQNYMIVETSIVRELLQILRDQEQFDYCVDVTAVHQPPPRQQTYGSRVLYSLPPNERLPVKTTNAHGR